MRHNKGLKTDPCGTPIFMSQTSESFSKKFVQIVFFFVRKLPAAGEQIFWHHKLQEFLTKTQ